MQGRRTQGQKASKKPGFIAGLLFAIALGLAAYLIVTMVFGVRTVTVLGNTSHTDEEIIHASGIAMGQLIFLVDRDRVAANIEQDRYLKFEDIGRNYPSEIVLRVSEYKTDAVLSWLGVLIELDENGKVLEQSNQLDRVWTVPTLSGVDVLTMDVGQPLVSKKSGQLDVLYALITQLKAQYIYSTIEEINVGKTESLYFITRDGLKVELGDIGQIEQKLQIYRAVLPQLTPQEKARGTLNISSGVSADFQKRQIYASEFKLDATLAPRETPTPPPE